MPRRIRLVLGLVLVALGFVLVFSPVAVGEALRRPAATPPQMINLRATWGGSVAGLGAFLAWLPALRPLRRFALGFFLWTMATIGVARAIGIVIDGSPDRLQWVWLAAEFVITAGCAIALRRDAARS
jgi:hypothetical protein